jgi:hypothetical protein
MAAFVSPVASLGSDNCEDEMETMAANDCRENYFAVLSRVAKWYISIPKKSNVGIFWRALERKCC